MEPKKVLLLSVALLTIISSKAVDITFQVNMSYQIELGNFNPDNDYVDVAGSFNGWGATSDVLTETVDDSLWTVTLTDLTAGSTIEFKFRINGSWDGTEEFPNGGPNRSYQVPSTAETVTYWYNDENPPTGPAIAGIRASSDFTYADGEIVFEEDASGLVEVYEWTFEGGNPASSNDSKVNVRYAEPGVYDVTLKVSNSFSEDVMVLEDFITVEERSTDDLDWWNETVFYEIFVRSFYDSDGDGIGDFQGIIEKLDYLNDGDPNTNSDLGITGIWLMPINNSPSYHGYDVTNYRAINPDYGTMADFEEFLEEAHKRGIKVIMDLVLNHTSTEHDWFKDSRSSKTSDKRNWYRWSDTNPGYSGPWGQGVWHSASTGYYYGIFWGGMPDLNYEEEAVRQEVFDITEYWLETVGVDGFRLDAVKYLYEDGSDLEDLPETHQFWREWVGVTKASNPDALSVGEAWTSTDKVVPYVVNEGLDFCFDFDLASAILNSVNSRNSSDISYQVNKSINAYPYYQFGTFTTNHDMNRLMDVLSSDAGKVKLASTIYLTLPGIPFIYYGEEVGMSGSKPDEDIRKPMSWSAGTNAGFSTSNPWHGLASNYQSYNVNDQINSSGSLLRHYRSLVQLRSKSKALGIGGFEEIQPTNTQVFAFKRQHEDEVVFTLVNLGSSSQTVTLDLSGLSFDFEEPVLGNVLGSEWFDVNNQSEITIELAPKTSMVLVPQELSNILSAKGQEFVKVYPNPATDYLQIYTIKPSHFELINLNGSVIKQGEIFGQTSIKVGDYNPGLYMLRIREGEQLIIKRVVLK